MDGRVLLAHDAEFGTYSDIAEQLAITAAALIVYAANAKIDRGAIIWGDQPSSERYATGECPSAGGYNVRCRGSEEGGGAAGEVDRGTAIGALAR